MKSRRLLAILILPLAACTSNGADTSMASSSTATVSLQARPVEEVFAADVDTDARPEATCAPGACTTAQLSAAHIVLDDGDGNRYQLGPTIFTDVNIASAEATPPSSGSEWTAQVALDGAGTTQLSSATAAAAQRSSPRNEIALILNGRVLTAPVILQPITSGHVVVQAISQDEAEQVGRLVRS